MEAYAFRSIVWKIYVALLVISTILYSNFFITFYRLQDVISASHSLPGFIGSFHSKTRRHSSKHVLDLNQIIPVSWNPRVFLFQNFLTDEECDYLIQNSIAHLTRSEVIDSNGEAAIDETRTSYSMFFNKGEDERIGRIEERISKWTSLSKVNAEGLQVSRYEVGQVNEKHFDYFDDDVNTVQGGNRMATVLMYLNDVEEGGETVFPEASNKFQSDVGLSDCARQGLAIKPKKGNALLFFSLHPNGDKDELSIHFSCPVLKGRKYVSVQWIHQRRFDEPTECKDEHAQCEFWAKEGDCENNPTFMTGTFGQCRKSCKNCVVVDVV